MTRLVIELERHDDKAESPLDAITHRVERILWRTFKRCGWLVIEYSEEPQ